MEITQEQLEKRRNWLENIFFKEYGINKQIIPKAILLKMLEMAAKVAHKFQIYYKHNEFCVWCDISNTSGFTYGCKSLENVILYVVTHEGMVKKLKNKIQNLFFERQIGLFEN